MTKINFPSSPSDGDIFLANTSGVYYVYDSTKDIWQVLEAGSVFSIVDAQTLEGEPGAYYLNYNNLSNRPALNFDTGNVTETVNLYYSNARVDARFDTLLATKTTSDLNEGTNQYFTNARARLAVSQGSGVSYNNSTGIISANVTSVAGRTGAVVLSNNDVSGLTTANVTELTNLYFSNARVDARFNTQFATKSTSDLQEGSNLYFSNSRAIAGLQASGGVFPSGTVMLFVQTNAPTGWTKDTSHNNKALRVVSGIAGTGGNTAFTTVFSAVRVPTGNVGNTTLTATQSGVAAHSHGVSDPTHSHTASMRSTDTTALASYAAFDVASTGGIAGTLSTAAAATGITINNATAASAALGHNHPWDPDNMDFAVLYVDVIIASKD